MLSLQPTKALAGAFLLQLVPALSQIFVPDALGYPQCCTVQAAENFLMSFNRKAVGLFPSEKSLGPTTLLEKVACLGFVRSSVGSIQNVGVFHVAAEV